jgi:cytidylate kinase
MIVTIDGGVASGKSAVGRRVADHLGLPFIDSGLMYRAITRLAAERGIDARNGDALSALARDTEIRIEGERVWADGVELTAVIYDSDFADALPMVSATPGVRAALVEKQREAGDRGVVMAGRDIGTVVFPDAEHKFFLTASVGEKVRRRAAQFEKRGEAVDEAAMRKEVELRDRVDSERPIAPLKPAEDAVIIDTDDLSLDDVIARVLVEIEETVGGE